jgi:PKD repeat protein
LKSKKKDIKVRELFRKKLDKVAIVPDDSVRRELMRRLETKEFLRFNLLRFNIWYLALITGTIITACILLFSAKDKSGDLHELLSGGNGVSENEIVIDRKAALRQSSLPGPVNSVSEKERLPVKSIITDDKDIASSENQSDSLVASPVPVKAVSEEKVLAGMKSSEKIVNSPASSAGNVLFEASATQGCTPLKVRFHINPGLCDSCRWTFGDGGISTEKDPEWIFDAEGEYNVGLTVFCREGLHATYFRTIIVHPRPVARFEISPENPAIPGGQVSFINYSNGAATFKWNFGDGKISSDFEPKHIYDKPGSYNVSLVAASDKGCIDSMKVENAFSGSEYFIRFPNAFIPNQQGPTGGYYSARSNESSDVFYPVFSGVTEYQLKIFSKLGILIFESNDINIGWDGYLDGVLNTAGVYIWKVRGKFRNGETFIRMGDVTLLRAASN